MTTLKFKTGVRYNGTRYAKGQVESGLSEKEVALFVKEDVAFVVGVPSTSLDEASTGQENGKQNVPPGDEENEAVYRDLDENWNADELKVDAERIGIEFDKKTLKKDLINLIIESGRAEELLAMLDDEDGE